MKVVLRSDVENVGHKGDIVDVANGFARNYLVRHGLAIAATDGAVRQADAMKRNRAAKDARDKANAEDLASKLTAATITITMRAGEGGKLFGSVTANDVAEAIASATGVRVDRKSVQLAEHIKELGSYSVSVRLHPQVNAAVAVAVTEA